MYIVRRPRGAADIDADEPPGLMADMDDEDDFYKVVDDADAEMGFTGDHEMIAMMDVLQTLVTCSLTFNSHSVSSLSSLSRPSRTSELKRSTSLI